MQVPAELDAAMLRAAVAGRWARLDVVAETASTNADLIAAAEAGKGGDAHPEDRTVLVAEHQVAGRGRLDRVWIAPARTGLTFSVLLRPRPPIAAWGWLPLLAGVALRDAVAASTGVDAALKWPNDLLCGPGRRKAAGILAQVAGGTGGPGSAVVVGVGLNVSTSAAQLPVETATSLALSGAVDLDRTALLAAILAEWDIRYTEWSAADGDAQRCGLADAYRAACATLGTPVAVALGGGTVRTGVAADVDDAGRLLVRSGEVVYEIAAGDVEHLRAAATGC